MAETKRAVSPGAEKWLGRVIEITGGGSIEVIDYMGDDARVARAARTSTGKDKTDRPFEGTIDYLMRNEHRTPFEMPHATIRVKAPIFVVRQWIRHRTWNFNEMSGRYTEMNQGFYEFPIKRVGVQSTGNKQGRELEAAGVTGKLQRWARDRITAAARMVDRYYHTMLDADVSREIARTVLPLTTMTVFYGTVDLRNLLHFLHLRLDPAAQAEIRDYAEVLEKFVADWVPVTYRSWVEHVRDRVVLSASQAAILRIVSMKLSDEQRLSTIAQLGASGTKDALAVCKAMFGVGFAFTEFDPGALAKRAIGNLERKAARRAGQGEKP